MGENSVEKQLNQKNANGTTDGCSDTDLVPDTGINTDSVDDAARKARARTRDSIFNRVIDHDTIKMASATCNIQLREKCAEAEEQAMEWSKKANEGGLLVHVPPGMDLPMPRLPEHPPST